MLRVYRRRQGDKSRWHFDTRCPNWPGAESHFVQSLHVTIGEPLCAECGRLEAELFRNAREHASPPH
jgi:hypothetical protein